MRVWHADCFVSPSGVYRRSLDRSIEVGSQFPNSLRGARLIALQPTALKLHFGRRAIASSITTAQAIGRFS
jgi:hypothetical protein